MNQWTNYIRSGDVFPQTIISNLWKYVFEGLAGEQRSQAVADLTDFDRERFLADNADRGGRWLEARLEDVRSRAACVFLEHLSGRGAIRLYVEDDSGNFRLLPTDVMGPEPSAPGAPAEMPLVRRSANDAKLRTWVSGKASPLEIRSEHSILYDRPILTTDHDFAIVKARIGDMIGNDGAGPSAESPSEDNALPQGALGGPNTASGSKIELVKAIMRDKGWSEKPMGRTDKEFRALLEAHPLAEGAKLSEKTVRRALGKR